MLRITIYTAVIAILMLGTASAQTADQPHEQGLPGYSNAARTDAEKKNDKDIDRAYQSAIKRTGAEKKQSDPWADVRSAPPTATNKQ